MHIILMDADFIRSENWDKTVELQLVLTTIQLCSDYNSTATLAEWHAEEIGCSDYVENIPARALILEPFMHT